MSKFLQPLPRFPDPSQIFLNPFPDPGFPNLISRFPEPFPMPTFPAPFPDFLAIPCFPEAEDYLAQGLQEEPLSARAREQRDAILHAFQRLKARLGFPEFPDPNPPEFPRIFGISPSGGIPPRFGILGIFQARDNGRILGNCRRFVRIFSVSGQGFLPPFLRKEFWDIPDLFPNFVMGISPLPTFYF